MFWLYLGVVLVFITLGLISLYIYNSSVIYMKVAAFSGLVSIVCLIIVLVGQAVALGRLSNYIELTTKVDSYQTMTIEEQLELDKDIDEFNQWYNLNKNTLDNIFNPVSIAHLDETIEYIEVNK